MADTLKQDITFLEYPLWMQNDRLEEALSWKDLNGFVYKTGAKPPARTDIIFLYYFLQQSQEDDWSENLELTQYRCLRECDIQPGKYWRDRLKESLERWMHVVVTFEGTFYNGKEHIEGITQFHIIDHWELDKKTKKLKIKLNPKWLEQIKVSTYYKILDFNQMKALRSPLTLRLYEILIKTFQTRNDWSCGAKKLAAKIPMNEKYVSDIIPKIKTAVKRINEKTELQIKLEVKRPERGKAIFYFEKTSVDKVIEKKEVSREVLVESKKAIPKKKEPGLVESSKKEQASFQDLLVLIPPEHREKKTIQDEISKHLQKNGATYVRGNILYTNENAKDKYRSYLNKALKENWGKGYLEDLQQKEEKRLIQKAEEEKKKQEEKKQQSLEQKAHEQFQVLTPEEYQKLEGEAKERLQTRDSSFLQGSFASIAIKMQMKVILIEQIKDELTN
jgi:hypothetical protein